jgi:hypothetical protein
VAPVGRDSLDDVGKFLAQEILPLDRTSAAIWMPRIIGSSPGMKSSSRSSSPGDRWKNLARYIEISATRGLGWPPSRAAAVPVGHSVAKISRWLQDTGSIDAVGLRRHR